MPSVGERQQCQHETQQAGDAQRPRGERRQAVDGQAQQMKEAERAAPAAAGGRHIGNFSRPEPHPGIEALHEAIALRQGKQRIHHGPVHEAEIAGIRRHLKTRAGIHQPIEPAGAQTLEQSFVAAMLAHRIDDVVALLPLRQHRGDQVGRMLQIGVHHQAGFATRRLHAGRERRFLAEIARQLDELESRLGRPEGEYFVRGVAAAVVHQDDFPVGHQRMKHALHTRQQAVQILRLVVAGDDDRQPRQPVARPDVKPAPIGETLFSLERKRIPFRSRLDGAVMGVKLVWAHRSDSISGLG